MSARYAQIVEGHRSIWDELMEGAELSMNIALEHGLASWLWQRPGLVKAPGMATWQ